VEAWVDEKKLARVKIGSPVDVTFAAFPDHKLRGQVESIGVLADKELRDSPVPTSLHSLFCDNSMIPVRIAVPNEPLRLQPGLSAFVGICDPPADSLAKRAGAADSFLAASVPLAGEPPAGIQAQRKLETKQH
jgi:multidrug resistance efflux pump